MCFNVCNSRYSHKLDSDFFALLHIGFRLGYAQPVPERFYGHNFKTVCGLHKGTQGSRAKTSCAVKSNVMYFRFKRYIIFNYIGKFDLIIPKPILN